MITPDQIKGTDEKAEQIRLFVQAANHRDKHPQLKWLHAIPNANSQRQVAEGVRAGISDVCLPYPVKHNFSMVTKYHGLYIELKLEKRRKEKGGGCSDQQIAFNEYANSVGYKAVVCYGWQEAWKAIEEYLNG